MPQLTFPDLTNLLARHPLTDDEIRMLRGLAAAINGGLYFFIAGAGADNFERLIGQNNNGGSRIVVIVLGIGASICYTMFCYLTLKYLTLRPRGPIATASAVLAPLAASPFYTAGVEGSKLFNINGASASVIGAILFGLRNINMVDGSVKLPGRVRELMKEWRDSFGEPRRNRGSLIRIAAALYTAVGYSVSTTDAIYAAVSLLLASLGLPASTMANIGLSYTGAALGALATFPMVAYWTDRGIRQATGGGQPDRDPTDQYTPLAAIATAPVILGILGSATSADGNVFARLGTTAVVIRFSSSISYAVFAGIPGLGVLFRGLKCCPRSSQSAVGANRHGLFAAVNNSDGVQRPLLRSVSENDDGEELGLDAAAVEITSADAASSSNNVLGQ